MEWHAADGSVLSQHEWAEGGPDESAAHAAVDVTPDVTLTSADAGDADAGPNAATVPAGAAAADQEEDGGQPKD